MKHGCSYLVGLQDAPQIRPKEGSWALVKYQPGGSTQVTPRWTTYSEWAKSVHVVALADGRDPTPGVDELSYSNENGDRETRIIASFSKL